MRVPRAALIWIAVNYVVAAYLELAEIVLWYLLVGEPFPRGIGAYFIGLAFVLAPIAPPFLLYYAIADWSPPLLAHSAFFLVVFFGLLVFTMGAAHARPPERE